MQMDDSAFFLKATCISLVSCLSNKDDQNENLKEDNRINSSGGWCMMMYL